MSALLGIVLLAACGRATATPSPAPSWSGGVIAFTSVDPAHPRSSAIGLVDRAGGLRLLPNSGGGASGWAPAWSPDGKWLAFIVHENDDNWPLYVIGSDGQNRQLLLSGDLYHYPAWSPDGTQLAYSRNGSIWVAPVSIHGTLVQLGSQKQLTFLDRQDASVPAWSPDGKQITFASELGDARGTASYLDPNSSEIYVMDADGSHLHKLTEDRAADGSPAWSPDGRQIAFDSDRDGNFEIYVMNADGSQPVRLTENRASDVSPVWSPDGRQIAFISGRDGSYEVYVMNADGSQPVRLTHADTLKLCPAWDPVVP